MLIKEILPKIVFGNPVAEFDKGLQNYFVVTDSFQRLVTGESDIISGDKGTGKTAIYQYLKQSYRTNPNLKNVEVITAFNPSGEPIFRRLGDESKMTEGQYITIWKIYILSLVGNWILREKVNLMNPKIQRLQSLLGKIGLLSLGDSASSVFTRLIDWIKTNVAPKEVGMDITFNEFGIPIYTPKVIVGKKDKDEAVPIEIISHDEAFTILENVLAERDITVWIVLDRLDEAFIGRPDIEIPALRALTRTFMDLKQYEHIELKLFVRNDLFRKITQEGFVNLTHVNARRTRIEWEEKDLFELVCCRIRNNAEILRVLGLNRLHDKALFNSVFPAKVDLTTTWKWMLNQIKDGNKEYAPRNLIDLCIFARDFQIKKDRNSSREYDHTNPIIDSESLKKAGNKLSSQRLEDTLMAEYGNDVKAAIKAFRNSKAVHTEQTIAELFKNSDIIQVRFIVKVLCDVGFLEQVGDTYCIPILYRASLNITKGKAGNNKNHDQRVKPPDKWPKNNTQ